jgi:hypothetical protein
MSILADVGKITLNTSWYAGWGTLALVNAGIAQGKHRSGLAWFLISVLFGPLATLLLVVLERGDPAE